MLLLPAFQRIGDVTVFADDTIWYRFYLIGNTPTVCRREDGSPVFLLVKYAFGDVSTDADDDLPAGGGTMNFDVEFVISDEDEAACRTQLQAWVNEEFHRRKQDNDLNDGPEFRGNRPPTVEFSEATWSHGQARMVTTSSEALVEGAITAGPASLLYGNRAVFQMDLTSHGASYMHDTLGGPEADDPSALAPIAVIYDLKFWGRLPPVTISVKASSERVAKELRKVSESHGAGAADNACTRDEIETYKQEHINSASLVESGIVEVHIDKRDVVLPDDQVEHLRGFALGMFDAMIEQRFLQPLPESEEDELVLDEVEHDGDGSAHTAAATLFQHRDYDGMSIEIEGDIADLSTLLAGDGSSFDQRISSLRVGKGHQIICYDRSNFQGGRVTYTSSSSWVGDDWNDRFRSIRVVRPASTRYKMKEETQTSTMDLEVQLTQSQVVEWSIHPQATLTSFFDGMSEHQMRQHLRTIDLGDDFFRFLQIHARAFADFENEPIAFVEVHIDYTGVDENGERQRHTHSFTFTESGEAQFWRVSLIGSDRDYNYSWRVGYTDGRVSPFSKVYRSRATELNISVEDPGRLDFLVMAPGIDWSFVQSVSVELRYIDEDNDVDVSHQVALNKLQQTDEWHEVLLFPVDKMVQVTPTYTLDGGQEIVGETFETNSQHIVVPVPHVDTLDVTLVPSGDWSDVAQAQVQLRYDDGQGPTDDASFKFTSIEQSASWSVRLRDSQKRTFEYQTLITYTLPDQPPLQTDWIEAEGDQAIVISSPAVPKLAVDVFTTMVDFDVTTAVAVTIAHPALDGGSQTLSFDKSTRTQVAAPVSSSDDREYTYTIRYMVPGEDQVVVGPVRSTETHLFIPALKRSEPGKIQVMVRGDLIDFDTWMLVQLDLSYTDPTTGAVESTAMVLSAGEKSSIWTIETSDKSHKVIDYTCTFFGAEDVAAGPSGELRSSVLILRNPPPSA